MFGMDYGLTARQMEIRDMVREFAETRVKPVRAELDEKEEFPSGILRELGNMDLMGLHIPEEYGGLGCESSLDYLLTVEELSRVCISVSGAYAASAVGADTIMLEGTENQKKRFLPSLASGEKWAAFALTEASAGSDVSGMAATARKAGDQYILNGTKQWVTNGGEADLYSIFAVTDQGKGLRGISCFVVEKDTPGMYFGKKERKLGVRALTTRELILEDAAIPAENLLGREGAGFMLAMRTLDRSRPGVAAQAVGLAQGALDEAVSHARTRIQFGKPIAAHQGLRWMLADMATQVEAARALLYATARHMDRRAQSMAKFSAICKLQCSNIAMSVATDALQVLGGYGYMCEYPLEKMMRDAKILQIYEGTNQIQRDVIGHALVKEYASHGP